jgi:glutamyl-tRNA synthetase
MSQVEGAENLEALLAEQQKYGAAVKDLKSKGVSGNELVTALEALKVVKNKILPILRAQYDAETDQAKKDSMAPKLRGYMDKKQQKMFDKERKRAKKAAATGTAGQQQAQKGGEKKLSKKQLAKLERKRRKTEATAKAKAQKQQKGGGSSENKAKGGKSGCAAVHFSFHENAVLPLTAYIANALTKGSNIDFKASSADPKTVPTFSQVGSEETAHGDFAIAKALAPHLYPKAAHQSIDQLVAWSKTLGESQETLSKGIATLNMYLDSRTYLADGSDGQFSLADITIYSLLDARGFGRAMDAFRETAPNVVRWYNLCRTERVLASAPGKLISLVKRARNTAKRNSQTDTYQELEGAIMGKVVTRFPPEPSGYLHIGHVKAAMLNEFYARKYKGKLIIRFDDTNPSKEKVEFEEAIVADLATLGIKADKVSHTSDYFEQIANFARQLIKQGDAYMDDTPQEQMQDERLRCVDSIHRGQSVQEALEIFEEMLKGTKKGQAFCLRGRMDMKSGNACLRDPVFFRYNPLSHHRTGTRYKAYPTYDFACPVVDSVEGVTHAMRSNEYTQRIPQNMWVVEKLGLRKYRIQEFGRLNFEFTLMSKRKLALMVANREVTGWDDPRFPTVRGMIRRGVQLPVLKNFILSQGFSKNMVNLKWDAYWSTNKKYLEPRALRFMAISKKSAVTLRLHNVPDGLISTKIPMHPSNAALGSRPFFLANEVWVEQMDAQAMKEGSEVTLMQWGNVFIQKIHVDEATGLVTRVDGESRPDGDFKSTELKICFVAKSKHNIEVNLVSFDFLITKAKLEEGDILEDHLTSRLHPTRQVTRMIGEPALRSIDKNSIVQIMRRGMARCDAPAPNIYSHKPREIVKHKDKITQRFAEKRLKEDSLMELFLIPDGKVKAMSSLATNVESIQRRN